MFYTPGWGAVLTVTGTLGGVIITQAANSWSTVGARRRERNDRINDAVGDLIACGNAWVYAVTESEEKVVSAAIRHLGGHEMMEAITAGQAVFHSAQLAYGRALARVRLTCSVSINDAAEDYTEALRAFEKKMRDNMSVVIETHNVDGVELTVPEGVVAPQDRLVEATRKETGRVLGG